MTLNTPLDFDSFWLSGPWRKLGKDLARRRFNATVKTAADMARIETARDRYKIDLAKRFAGKPWDETKIMHGGTWFGLWEDYAELAKSDGHRQAVSQNCDYCRKEHDGDHCPERRRDYDDLKARIAAATGKLAMGGKS